MATGQAADAVLRIDPSLHFLLKPQLRGLTGRVAVPLDGTSTIVHLVESVGIPRTEFGPVLVDGRAGALNHVPTAGQVVDVPAVARPQRGADRGFLLDVGLGSLARAMRLLGLDARYSNDAADDELVAAARDTGRMLLTQDRGLLRRRSLPAGALVRGQGADAQLDDVLDRFAPPLAPWTRCPACNGPLLPVPKAQVAPLLDPGTRAGSQQFARCGDCSRIYWRGAHERRLTERINRAERIAARRRAPR